MVKHKKKKAKVKLSQMEKAAQRLKRDHERFVRETFRSAGFRRLSAAANKEFVYKGATSDFDDVFLLENVLVVAEYTTSSESHVSTHLKNKKIIYDKIQDDTAEFVGFVKTNFPSLATEIGNVYKPNQFHVRVVYASRNPIKAETKANVPELTYLDYSYLRYFHNVTGTVKLSARYELLDFLKVKLSDFGDNIFSTATSGEDRYAGSILPESHSHFPDGFKVASFYVDAAALLKRSYVLRRDGWRVGGSVYQRMILRTKVEAIRKHLVDGNGSFVNNIVVTLPSDTVIVDENNVNISSKDIIKTTAAYVKLPLRPNSIGLIDGQHRVFAYHEGGIAEDKVSLLRKQQNLLATGIIFPSHYGEIEKMRFQAKLFLEINSNQTTAKSALIQEIGLILRPFAADSVAKRVLNLLSDGPGPLGNKFEKYFYDKGLLKPTTIVSYGLKPLVRIGSGDSLFSLWSHPEKEELQGGKNDAALEEYAEFCAKLINRFIGAARAQFDSQEWTTETKPIKGVLNTTFVNGLLACLRQLVATGEVPDTPSLIKYFNGLEQFKFREFKSSQYNRLGVELFSTFLAPSQS